MIKPLALMCYENLLPGSQLTNRLHDLGYRVQTTNNPDQLQVVAEKEKPLLVIIDLLTRQGDVCAAISLLRATQSTEHIPVLAFANVRDAGLHEKARAAGASMVANDTVLLEQLPHLLEQVLQLD